MLSNERLVCVSAMVPASWTTSDKLLISAQLAKSG